MISLIPKNIQEVYKKIEDNGFEVYFVGGCARNLLLEQPVKDWDFATSAKPEEILKLFPNGFYDNKFGTVGIPIDKQIVEITTYRTEHGFSDQRHPEKVEWGKTIEDDLSRRDFTINAIAFKIVDSNPEFIDPFDGKEDLKKKLIKAVGNPKERFKEDALRLMRAVRFATQLSFTIEGETWVELANDSELLKKISWERIRDEFFKILASNYPYEGIILLKNAGLLQIIIPELFEGENVSQARPGRHHTTDVLTHNLMSLKHCPSENPVVRFAALIHDVGKGKAATKDEEGFVVFHNHEVIGAKMAREICERLRLSKKDRSLIVNLVRWHMFTVDDKITDAAIRRFIRRVSVESVKEMMDLRVG
ncbi:CCA tRNA nucleotidyltransferase, partial [Patescibacteria group bacterium]|nr:CCA tRNA nucleotidyltransferase [Patescibacteria group bacterium]